VFDNLNTELGNLYLEDASQPNKKT